MSCDLCVVSCDYHVIVTGRSQLSIYQCWLDTKGLVVSSHSWRKGKYFIPILSFLFSHSYSPIFPILHRNLATSLEAGTGSEDSETNSCFSLFICTVTLSVSHMICLFLIFIFQIGVWDQKHFWGLFTCLCLYMYMMFTLFTCNVYVYTCASCLHVHVCLYMYIVLLFRFSLSYFNIWSSCKRKGRRRGGCG